VALTNATTEKRTRAANLKVFVDWLDLKAGMEVFSDSARTALHAAWLLRLDEEARSLDGAPRTNQLQHKALSLVSSLRPQLVKDFLN
jgi:hypothetical protein